MSKKSRETALAGYRDDNEMKIEDMDRYLKTDAKECQDQGKPLARMRFETLLRRRFLLDTDGIALKELPSYQPHLKSLCFSGS